MPAKTPKDALEAAQGVGLSRVNLTVDQVFVLSFMSGLYIGLGGLLALVVGGNVPVLQAQNPGLQKLLFGTTFSVGLMFVVHTGCDLWTGTIMVVNVNLISSKTRLVDVFNAYKNLFVSFIGNFCGAVFVAFFFCYLLNKDGTDPWIGFLKNLGKAKTTKDPWFLFISAIGCNILVNTAVFMSIVADEVPGKLLSIFAAIGTFVTIGFEHLVANMFFLPAAAMFGGDVPTWKLLFWNLAVVAFGNYIGGVFFFGLSFWFAHQWRPAHKSYFYNLFASANKRLAKSRGFDPDHNQNDDHQHTVDLHDQHAPKGDSRELADRPLQTTSTTQKQAEFQV